MMARPREFEMDAALRVALRLFWEKGFDGLSLTEIAQEAGIVRPSLQAAFGSKEDLYRKAIDLYGRESMAFVVKALRGETAREVCRLYLVGYCDMLSDPSTPVGCFMVKGLVAESRGASIAREEGLKRQAVYSTLLEQRFRQAHEDGDLAPDADAALMAEQLTTLTNGLAVRADMGATRLQLHAIAEAAVKRLA